MAGLPHEQRDDGAERAIREQTDELKLAREMQEQTYRDNYARRRR